MTEHTYNKITQRKKWPYLTAQQTHSIKYRLRERGQTEPGLVALYDIWPANEAGLFLQSRSPHWAYGPARAPFPGRMSYKATKPGLSSVLYPGMRLYGIVVY